MEIDIESENRAELVRRAQVSSNKKMKSLIEMRVEKSDEKLDSMTVLMLHYCAGLQHCLDQEEVERVKQQEEETSRNDREATADSTLEHISANLDNVLVMDYSTSSVEGASGHDGELNISAAMLTDRSKNTEPEIELLAADVSETEVSSEVEEEKVEDVTVALDNKVSLSACWQAVSPETEENERAETPACGEDTLAETNTGHVPSCSAEQVDDKVNEPSDAAVESCGIETAWHDGMTHTHDNML